MTQLINAIHETDAPPAVCGLVAFAVLVLPGGIPLTLALLPPYLRRRNLQNHNSPS